MSKKGCRITADRRRVAFAMADADAREKTGGRKSARDDCNAAAWLEGPNGNCPVPSLAQESGCGTKRVEKRREKVNLMGGASEDFLSLFPISLCRFECRRPVAVHCSGRFSGPMMR